MSISALVSVGVCVMTASNGADIPKFLQNGVTAHRGNAGQFPENTMAAFESALKLGADWIELDIFRTKDGKIAVIHDADTARVGDRTVTVAEVAYEELAQVDVAHAFRQKRGLSVAECPPQRAPLLEEVLALIKTQHRTRVSIQPKEAIVDEAVALVKRMNAAAWVGFNDGDLSKMKRVKELEPSLHVFWDWSGEFELARDIPIAKESGFESIVVYHEALTEEVVRAITDAGFEPGAWTVNDPERMAHLQKLGIFRFYTDYPLRALREKGLIRAVPAVPEE